MSATWGGIHGIYPTATTPRIVKLGLGLGWYSSEIFDGYHFWVSQGYHNPHTGDCFQVVVFMTYTTPGRLAGPAGCWYSSDISHHYQTRWLLSVCLSDTSGQPVSLSGPVGCWYLSDISHNRWLLLVFVRYFSRLPDPLVAVCVLVCLFVTV